MAAAAEQPEGPWPFARMAASSLVHVLTYIFLALPCPADKGPTARPLGATRTDPLTGAYNRACFSTGRSMSFAHKAAPLMPLLPVAAVILLLPFGRASEAAVLACMIGALILFVRSPVLRKYAASKLLLALWSCYFVAALISA